MRLGGLQPNVNSSGIPRTYLPSYLLTFLPTYLLTYLPTLLPTYLPFYLPTYLPLLPQVMGGMMLLALHGPGGISLDQGAKKSI